MRLKGYRTTKKIGFGDMTEVHLAERETDGLPIVLKMLDSRGKEASEHLVRFIQEYALLAKIVHQHVIRIYKQGFSDEHAYIAMEYFERGDLRSLFGPALTPSCAVRTIPEITLALEAIHQSGIVHRDIKPENIMLRAEAVWRWPMLELQNPCCKPMALGSRKRATAMLWERRVT